MRASRFLFAANILPGTCARDDRLYSKPVQKLQFEVSATRVLVQLFWLKPSSTPSPRYSLVVTIYLV